MYTVTIESMRIDRRNKNQRAIASNAPVMLDSSKLKCETAAAWLSSNSSAKRPARHLVVAKSSTRLKGSIGDPQYLSGGVPCGAPRNGSRSSRATSGVEAKVNELPSLNFHPGLCAKQNPSI